MSEFQNLSVSKSGGETNTLSTTCGPRSSMMNITEDQKTVRLDATYPQTSSVNFSNTHSYAQESNTISELSKLNP